MKKIKVLNKQTVQKGNLVAFYRQMEALGYTAERPLASAKGVVGIDLVQDINEHEVKGYSTGWWHQNSVLKINARIAMRWLQRYHWIAWPPITGYNR